ncbi:TPA: AraC family transcriptional regulator, partial [Acinetobacter baumannii]|nr:AraC family transcriptional regulator [Acinetobacter baumannii]HCV3146938.1 AraC family transcriptional regulator [Acinetobacter baumannii]
FYAKALNITPYYLSKLSKQFFNDNAKTLIDRQVILKLKELLRTPSNSIQSIADQLNFEDTSYMCRYFKKHTGFTLLQYRKNA